MGEVDLITTTDEDLRFAVNCVKDAVTEYAPFADKQFVYIENYQVFDDGLHILSYADGCKVIGNYSEKEVVYNGKKIMPYGYIIE